MINLSKFLPFFIPNVYRACSFFTNLDLFLQITRALSIEKYGNRTRNLFNCLGNTISYEGELDTDNKLNNFLESTGILNNVFRPQKTL